MSPPKRSFRGHSESVAKGHEAVHGSPLMEWSDRAPAPPVIEAGKGALFLVPLSRSPTLEAAAVLVDEKLPLSSNDRCRFVTRQVP